MRRIVLLLSALALTVAGLGVPATTAHAAPVSLRGMAWGGDITPPNDADCNPDGSGSWSFTRQKAVTSPVVGTYSESGTVTVGGPDPVTPGNRVTMTSTFSLVTSGGTYTGTMTAVREPVQRQFNILNIGYCNASGPWAASSYVAVDVAFEGQPLESGHATWSRQGLELWLVPRVFVSLPTLVAEGGPAVTGGLVASVSIFPDTFTPVSVHVATTGGTATPVDDYAPVDAVLTVQPGETGSPIVPIPVVDDAVVDPDETVEVTFDQLVGGVFENGVSTATAVIQDNENVFRLPAAVTVPETDGGVDVVPTFAVPQSGNELVCLQVQPESTATRHVDYTGPGGDPLGCDILANFPPQFPLSLRLLSVLSDTDVEPDETVVIKAIWGYGVQIDPAADTVTVTIQDNDAVTFRDADADAVEDTIDTDAGTGTAPSGSFSDATASGGTTSGRLTSRGGTTVQVSDLAAPFGVHAVVTGPPGAAPATFTTCGVPAEVYPGSDVEFRCGSLITAVTAGRVVLPLGNGTTVTIPAGVTAEVAASGTDGWTVDVLADTSGSGATLTVGGQSQTVRQADPVRTVRTWTFTGFAKPLLMTSTNVVTAGSDVHFVFTVRTATGAPVTRLAVKPYARTAKCGTTRTPTMTAGSTATRTASRGSYDVEWRTPRSLAGTCGRLGLDIGDGAVHEVDVRFR